MEFSPYGRGRAKEVLAVFYSPVRTGLLLAPCFYNPPASPFKEVSRWVFCFDGGSVRSREGKCRKYRDNPHISVD